MIFGLDFNIGSFFYNLLTIFLQKQNTEKCFISKLGLETWRKLASDNRNMAETRPFPPSDSLKEILPFRGEDIKHHALFKTYSPMNNIRFLVCRVARSYNNLLATDRKLKFS